MKFFHNAFLATALMLLFQISLQAQGIRGTVKGTNGAPLPFVSIHIANLNNGASSNEHGEFEIKLPSGKHTVVVQFIGYKAEQTEITVSEDWITRNFVLQEQGFALKQVDVKGKKEDPAYTIIRKAIAKRKFHRLQYDSYQMKVYVKLTRVVTDIPFFMKNSFKELGISLNEAYSKESVSLIEFKQPNKITEKVLSIRSKGDTKGSPSPSAFIQEGFYNERVGDAVSPLSKEAFGYYKFEYVGSFEEGNVSINKIKVIPRSRGDNVFEGYIYIIEDLWAIHSLDLKTSVMGIPVRVRQNYAEIAPTLWMPITHKIFFSGKMMGFAGEYNYLASISDYKVELNEDLIAVQTEIIDEKVEEVPAAVAAIKTAAVQNPETILAREDKLTRKQFYQAINAYEKEALKELKQPEVISDHTYEVDSLASNRDSSYWASIRSVPLTKEEEKSYARSDSLAMVAKAEPGVKDSTHPADSVNKAKRTTFKLFPVPSDIGFNTVEGFYFSFKMGRFKHIQDSLRTLEITPVFRYGLAGKNMYGKTVISHKIKKDGITRETILEGGKFVQQFNHDEPIHPIINTLSSLLLRENYMKLYEKLYLKAGYDYKPSPFLHVSGNMEWARRTELFNQTDYSFFFKDKRNYSRNQPYNEELTDANRPDQSDTSFPEHEALVMRATISYRPRGTYRIDNGKKIPLLENSPELLLKYRKGISGILGSDVNFDEVELGLNHSIAVGIRGMLAFELRGGAFLNNRSMFFMDYHHFDGNQTIFSSMKPAGSFRLLDYYRFSTNNAYFSGHTHYQFRKFLLTRIPNIRFAGIKENIFVNYLKTVQSPHYYEIGYSLDNVFRAFRVEVATSFADRKFEEAGIRVGIATTLMEIIRN